jgi:hypothetical protein
MISEIPNTPCDPAAAAHEDYSNQSLPQLQAAISIAKDHIAGHQADLNSIAFEIGRRFSDYLLAEMEAKEARSTTIEAPDGFKIKGSVSKTVSWDSSALQKLAAEMDWAKAQHYFRIKFSVAEAMFKSVEPGEFKDKLTDARTTKDGQLKIEMIAPKNEEN